MSEFDASVDRILSGAFDQLDLLERDTVLALQEIYWGTTNVNRYRHVIIYNAEDVRLTAYLFRIRK